LRVICAWCKKELPEKEPFSDSSISHSICKDCQLKIKLEADEFFEHYSEREWEK